MELLELIDKRTQLLKEIENLINKGEKENRELNEDETNNLSVLKSEIEEIDKEIQSVQDSDKNLKIRSINTSKKNNNIDMDRNFKDILTESRNGDRINNFKVETRAVVLSTGVYPTSVEPTISAVGYTPFYEQMGVQVLKNLQGSSLKLPYVNGIIASKVTEGNKYDNDKTLSYVNLLAERFSITESFSFELLAVGNEIALQGVISEMVKGVDRLITKTINDVAFDGGTELTSGATYSVDNMNTLTASVDGNVTLLFPRAEFYKAKAIKVDTGSGLFLANRTSEFAGNLWDGTPLFYSSLFSNITGNTVVAVDLNHIVVGEFGNDVEVIFEYKGSTGMVEVTVVKLASVALRNPNASRIMKIG